MKKLIAVLLTFTMLFTMFTSFSIVTTNAASTTHQVEKIIWTQDFEKNQEGDDEAYWAAGTANNRAYSAGGRFNSASVGTGHLVDDADSNYLLWYPNTNGPATSQQASVKVFLDQTNFELGKTYKVTAEISLDINSVDDDNPDETRGFSAFMLAGTGLTTVANTKGSRIHLKEGQKAIVSTKEFKFTQDFANVVDGLNLRIDPESQSLSAVQVETGIDKDKYTVDNVRIIEVTDVENVLPENEGSVFEEYIIGTVMDFENLPYNTYRPYNSSDPSIVCDTDSNGEKYIVNDPTGADNKVFRSPFVSGVSGGSTSARTELIGLLANCNNEANKTYTVSFKMYPQGYSDVPVSVGFKKDPTMASPGGSVTKNLVEEADFTPNQWNNITFDITTTNAETLNFSLHQHSLNNGNSMDFDNHTYYHYIYIDDLKITEKVNVETYFADENIYNEEKWDTSSSDIFTVGADKIEIAASEGAEELSFTFNGVQNSAMVINYTANVEEAAAIDDAGALPYVSVCTSQGDELAISKLDNPSVNGTLIFNVPNDEENPGQFTDLSLNIVAGNVAAEITDFSLVSVGAHYEFELESTDDAKIKVTADFGELNVPETEFTAVALSEGETVTNFTKDMIDLYPSANANGASEMEIEIDMVDVDEYRSIFSIILYNEANSIYLNVGDVEYINPNFAYTVLGLIQAAGDADEVQTVIEAVDDVNNIVYKEVLELDTIEFFENATDDDLEIIYTYIFNNKDEIINYENTGDLTLLHNVVKKAIPVAMVKNGYDVELFRNYVDENGALLGVSAYTKYLADGDTYSNILLGSFLEDIAADDSITTFDEIMEAIEAFMEETPGDLDVYTYFHDMENGDFGNLTLNTDYEQGGEGEREFGVVKASDEGITDPNGDPNGHLFKYVSTSSARIKFTDIFNPTGVTPRDLGSQYEISFDMYRVEGTPLIRLFSVKDFNASGTINSNAKSSKYATGNGPTIDISETEIGQWCHVTFSYTLNNLMITSLGMEKGTTYFDNFKVKRVVDNRRELNPSDLQPLDNEAALTLSGVTETADGYEFANGGTLKYGVGTAEKQGQKYVAKKGGYYMVSLVAKTNSENALTLTANSSQVQRSSAQLENANDYPNLTTYPVKDVDDFILEVGNSNDVIIISGSTLAEDGVTMVNTNGEFKTIIFIFKDTGANGAVNYLGKEMEILRSINITANEDGAVVKSMVVKEYNANDPIENADFDSETAFEGWGTTEVDTSAFANEAGVLTITGSEGNAGKEMVQTVLLPSNTVMQLAFTNVDNGEGDALIAAFDTNGNILSKMEFSPVEAAETDKVFVFKTPESAADTVPVTLKFIAGETGTNTIDNLVFVDEEDDRYVDLTDYVSYTGYFNTLSSTQKEAILSDVFEEDYETSEDFIKAVCDGIVNYRLENANENHSVIVDILAENADCLGLTNWDKVEDVSKKSYYSDVKKGIAKYVIKYGYETLNDEIEDIIDDAKDSGDNGGGTGGNNNNNNVLPPNVTSTNTPVAPSDDVNFSDLSSAEWARESIVTLASKGIISGYGDGTVKPNNEITRAEFAKMLVIAFNVYDPYAYCNSFSDVNPSDWYYSYVATLANLGVTNGMGDGTYGANEKITRQDMVVLIVRMTQLLGNSINATAAEVTFNDNGDIAAYAAEAVKTLQKAQIVSGFEDGTFRPGATATRAQVAKILCALIG